jgi:hypothetical protein
MWPVVFATTRYAMRIDVLVLPGISMGGSGDEEVSRKGRTCAHRLFEAGATTRFTRGSLVTVR